MNILLIIIIYTGEIAILLLLMAVIAGALFYIMAGINRISIQLYDLFRIIHIERKLTYEEKVIIGKLLQKYK